MERKVDVVEDLDGKKTVFIHDILFKGKRTINWGEVERYLKRYVGEIYTVAASNDVVYIGLIYQMNMHILIIHIFYGEQMLKQKQMQCKDCQNSWK